MCVGNIWVGVLKHFGTKSYVWRIDIAQNLYEFYKFFLCGCLGPKCFKTPKSYTTKSFQKFNCHLPLCTTKI